MKTIFISILLAGFTLASALQGQVPHTLSYQGHLAVNGQAFNSPGEFKFALVDETGAITFWSNDDTSMDGGEPANPVILDVVKGHYSVLLGDVTLPNMTAIPHSVFANPGVHLRIWFNDGNNGFQQLAPDQLISSVGYAMMAADVPDGAITSSKLADDAIDASKIADGAITESQLAPNSVNSEHIIDGEVKTVDLADNAVTTAKLADSAVTSAKLADHINLGSASATGSLRVWNGTGADSIRLHGGDHRITTFGSDGLERTRLFGKTRGELWLHGLDGKNRTVYLTAGNDGSIEPQLDLDSSEGQDRVNLVAGRAGGILRLYGNEGHLGAVLYGNEGTGSSALSLRDPSGAARARLFGGPAGRLLLYNQNGTPTVTVNADFNGGSRLVVRNGAETAAVQAWTWENKEGVLTVHNQAGSDMVYLWGRNSQGSGGGQIGLKKDDGTQTIVLNANHNGEGRITTQVLQITGGSDLSEQFNINVTGQTLEPGMVVSIDPENPGELRLSTQAYDYTVAGIVSGAGGIKPGMLMGQAGTKADGKHPVALTGRVYCWIDADYGAIRPGDLITTSDTPGHGMRVSDHLEARGAIIGKAMTSLESGRGLVLVLVSLQ
jgi:hypothetical protein